MRAAILPFLACAAVVSSTGTHCHIQDLAAVTSCGCSKVLTRCLSSTDISSVDAVLSCYVEAGCSSSEAEAEAELFMQECHDRPADSELRRRREYTTVTTTADSPAQTSAKHPPSTSAPKTTTAALLPRATTDAAPLVCSITKTVSTSICSYSNNKQVGACTPTTVPVATCAPGNLCFPSVDGKDVCMRKDNSLTLSGLIVAIVFAVGLVGSLLTTIILHVRAVRKAKKDTMVAQMMKSQEAGMGGMSAVPAGMGVSEDHLPLIPPKDGPRGVGGGQQQEMRTAGTGAPRLHQGLGALGEENRF